MTTADPGKTTQSTTRQVPTDIVDLTPDAILSAVGAKNNGAIFADGTHPTAAGCDRIVDIAEPVFAAAA